jgi:Na+/H+ antiporter NhaD/arsenite permease-like protein
MILLVLVTAVGSAFLDNVTTVLLIAPVTLLVCERLAVSPVPFLIVEAFAANIGGAATLVGDPTSIIIGTGAHLSFISFLANMGPAVIMVLAVLLAAVAPPVSRRLHRRSRAGRRCHGARRERSDQ